MSAWTTAKVKLTELNPHLICVLCGGYYVDATTITECLHTFCKTCIVRYLDSSKYCPVCDVMVHKTKPLLHIRSDHLLQALVYKMVPGLFTSEITKRKLFYEDGTGSGSPPPPDEESLEEGMLGSKHRTTDIMDHYTQKGAEKEKISVSLQFSPNGRPIDEYDFTGYSSDSELNEEMTHPRYLLCPAGFSVYHLKKFLRMKFDLNDSFLIDIFHIDEPLCDKYTLMDIAYVYAWRRLGPLRLYYSVYQNPAKRRKHSHVTSVAVPPADEVIISEGIEVLNEQDQSTELPQKSSEKTNSVTAQEASDVRLVGILETTEDKKHKKSHHSKSKSHKRNKKDKDKNKERRKKKKKSKKSQIKSSKHKSHKSSKKRKELESICDVPVKCSRLSMEENELQPADSCSATESLGEGTSGTAKIEKKRRHSKDRKDKCKNKKSKKKTEKVKPINDRQPILLKLHKETYQLKASNDGKDKHTEKSCFQRKDAQEIMKHVDMKKELFKNCTSEQSTVKTVQPAEEVKPAAVNKADPQPKAVKPVELPSKPKEVPSKPKEVPSKPKEVVPVVDSQKDVRKTVKVLVPKERHRKEQAVVAPTCKSLNGNSQKPPEPMGPSHNSAQKEKVSEASKKLKEKVGEASKNPKEKVGEASKNPKEKVSEVSKKAVSPPKQTVEPKVKPPVVEQHVKVSSPVSGITQTSEFQQAFMKHLDNKSTVSNSVDESKSNEESKPGQSKETISKADDSKAVSPPRTVSSPKTVVPNGISSSPDEPKANGSASIPVNGQKKLEFRPFGSKTVIRPAGHESKRKCLSDITFPLARPVNKVSHKSPSLSPVIPEGGLGKLSPPPHLKLTLPKYPLLSDRQSKSKSPSHTKKQLCVSSDMQPLDLAGGSSSSSSSSSSKSPRAKSPSQSCRQPVVLNQPKFNINHGPNKMMSVSPTKNPLSVKISLSPTRSTTPLYPQSKPKESLQRQTSLPEARHQMPQLQPSRPTDYPLVARKSDASRFAQKRPATAAAASTAVDFSAKPEKSPKRNGSEVPAPVSSEAVDLTSDSKYSEVNHNSIQIVNEPGPSDNPKPQSTVIITDASESPSSKTRSPAADRSNTASPASSSSSVQTQTDLCEVKTKCVNVARPNAVEATL